MVLTAEGHEIIETLTSEPLVGPVVEINVGRPADKTALQLPRGAVAALHSRPLVAQEIGGVGRVSEPLEVVLEEPRLPPRESRGR
jgi:hypothetical protein